MSNWDWQNEGGRAFAPEPEAYVHGIAVEEVDGDGPDLALINLVHQRLITEIDPQRLYSLERPQAYEAVIGAARRTIAEVAPNVVGVARDHVLDAVSDEVLGLGPIEKLVRDPAISEIMVNGPELVYFEQAGVIYKSRIHFRDDEHIMRIIQRIVAPLGRRIDEASPYVDARLPDGSRVNAIIPPISYRGPLITIRKFLGDRYTVADLVGVDTMSQNVADFLAKAVQARLNVLISGGTGTGKTTLLNALSANIGERERIITIEDPAELKLQQEHVLGLEVRPANIEGKNEVTQRDLVRNALRMRPDRIIVGEVRGSEAFDMMQAMNTGHEGSMTTIHANTPRDALARLENMILMAGYELPIYAIREQVSSALHLVVQISRLSDGTRRVISVTEITGQEGNTITMQDLFLFERRSTDENGRIIGTTSPTGIRPHYHNMFSAAGVDLPLEMFLRSF